MWKVKGSSAGSEAASNIAAHILHQILRTIPECDPPPFYLDLPLPESLFKIAGECSDCGRCLSRLCASLPIAVDMQQISRLAFEHIMRRRFGSEDLQHILLLITPMQQLPPNQEPLAGHVTVHCFHKDSRKHLGVAPATAEELLEIERCNSRDSYSIVYCSRYIEEEDAVRNTPIKDHIFKVVREASKAVIASWYKGCSVRLFFRGCEEKRKASFSPSRARAEPEQSRSSVCRKLCIRLDELKGGLCTLGLPVMEESISGNMICHDYADIFCRPVTPRSALLEPPIVPVSFSNAAFCFLEPKLRWASARGLFLNLRRTVENINERQRPRLPDLMQFFKLAQYLELKLYIRREAGVSGSPIRHGNRFVVDCYVFDDRQEYVATISLQETELHAFARVFPGARHNFRFVDSGFALTPVPERVCTWLETAMDAINRRRWFKYLGEVALEKLRPPMAILELPEDAEIDPDEASI